MKNLNPVTVAEDIASRTFRALGLHVERPIVRHGPNADFLVDGDQAGYVVEVKTRTDNPSFDDDGRLAEEARERSMLHDDKIGDFIARAKKQACGVDPCHERLWFAWISIESPLSLEAYFERTLRVLYGVRDAFDVDDPSFSLICFHAARPLLQRMLDIDGVFVEGGGALALILNEWSPRFARACESAVAQRSRDAGQPQTAAEWATLSGGLVVPPGIDLKDYGSVLRHLQAVTGRPYLNLFRVDTAYRDALRIRL